MSLSEASGAEFVKHVTNLEKDIMTTMVSAMGCILSSQSFTDLSQASYGTIPESLPRSVERL